MFIQQTRILVLETDEFTQCLLAVALEGAGYKVSFAGTVKAAEVLMADHRPAVLLVGWMLPDRSGVSLIRQLRSDPVFRDVAVMMLSDRHDECDKVSGLEAGADDYLTKPFSTRELLARIHALLRRRAPELTEDVLDVAGLHIDPSMRRVMVDGKNLKLGGIEFRMLHFFATHVGWVFSREQILDRLWVNQSFVQDRTVDTHVRDLRLALRPTGHDALIETVRGCGYRFREAFQPDRLMQHQLN